MLAGFYEDVSAVARGWKMNPVSFDSIINRSKEAWAWGSPDIVLMFTETVKHATGFVYSPQLEDFAQEDAAKLDSWVFDEIKAFIENANDELKSRLKSDRIIFFLHLLGLDINGHGNKPKSAKYVDNIAVVDKGISEIVEIFDSFYGDNRTAYIFTADHGMTDWGSHGAGTDAEIITPIVIWGSGVKVKPYKNQINQIDLSALMSSLLGLPIPMNSMGSVPLHILDAPPRYQFQSVYANFKQMCEQYLIKRGEKKAQSLSFMFREYVHLRPKTLFRVETEIKRLLEQKRFEAAIVLCIKWIPVIRSGILHFHRHDRELLGFAIALTFLAWIAVVYFYATSDDLHERILWPRTGCQWTIGLMFGFLCFNGLQLSHCLYITLPMYIACVCQNIINIHSKHNFFWLSLFSSRTTISKQSFTDCAILTTAFLLVIAVFIVLLVATFFYRSLLSVELVLIGFLPLVIDCKLSDMMLWKRLWLICCCLAALFPQFPVVGQQPMPVLCLTSSFLISAILFLLRHNPKFPISKNTTCLLASLHLIATVVIASFDAVGDQTFLFLVMRTFCWLSIPISIALPIITASGSLIKRLFYWFSSLLLPYTLLSVSYESLFLILLILLLIIHIRLQFTDLNDDQFIEFIIRESSAADGRENKYLSIGGAFSLREWRHCMTALVLLEAAFFSVGNIASLNSFNPSFVQRFITLFSPFTMTAVFVIKILIPILICAFTYVVILRASQMRIGRFSLLVLCVTDAMSMVFFFRLKDEGTWLEIGTSISHYVISMLLSVIVYVLLNLTEFLLTVELPVQIYPTVLNYLLQSKAGKNMV